MSAATPFGWLGSLPCRGSPLAAGQRDRCRGVRERHV